jgi:hypothetical protein
MIQSRSRTARTADVHRVQRRRSLNIIGAAVIGDGRKLGSASLSRRHVITRAGLTADGEW